MKNPEIENDFERLGEQQNKKYELSITIVTTKEGTEIFYKDWGTGQPLFFPSRLAADCGRLGCAEDVLLGQRFSCNRP